MRPNSIAAVVLALAMVLAGCTGGTVPGGGDDPATTTGADDPAVDDGQVGANGGAVNFWISDEPNDIDDFEHLNVTVTKVAFHRVGDADGNATDADEDADEAETDRDEDDGSGDGEWVERDVDDRTVDLTRLKGANATLVGTFDLPNGSYDKVFLYVGEINATLAGSGESANVKLPSERLHLNQGFEVTPDTSPDFVFDISVHKAGKSGKYILKPVVSESGTDVPIRDADDRGPPEDRGEDRGPPEDRGEDRGPPEDRGNGNGQSDGRIEAGEAVDRRVATAGWIAASAITG